MDDKETFREQGIVAAVEGDRVTVVINEDQVDEERCISCGACHRGEKGKTLKAVSSGIDIGVGDTVVVECTTKNVYLAIILIFLLPLLGLGAGAAIGYLIPLWATTLKPWHTGITVFLSLVGMTFTFLGVMIYSRWRMEPKHPDPVIVELVGRADTK
ncbi:MAG: hypothetical protein E3J72_06435 [Planctomycetota bacterium]|nr:MAG: hypothetical protein E3J72_06435 [Planctomycetota bacterium]